MVPNKEGTPPEIQGKLYVQTNTTENIGGYHICIFSFTY